MEGIKNKVLIYKFLHNIMQTRYVKNGTLTRDYREEIIVVALKSLKPVVIMENLEIKTTLMATKRLTTKMYGYTGCKAN